jgi:hypothetical protein
MFSAVQLSVITLIFLFKDLVETEVDLALAGAAAMCFFCFSTIFHLPSSISGSNKGSLEFYLTALCTADGT